MGAGLDSPAHAEAHSPDNTTHAHDDAKDDNGHVQNAPIYNRNITVTYRMLQSTIET